MASVKPTIVGSKEPSKPRLRPEPGLAEAMRRYDAEKGDPAERDRFKYTAQMLNRLYGEEGVRRKFGVGLYDLAKTWRSTDHYKIMKRKIAQLETKMGRPLTKPELTRVVRRVLDDLADAMSERRKRAEASKPPYIPEEIRREYENRGIPLTNVRTTPSGKLLLPLPDIVRELAAEEEDE